MEKSKEKKAGTFPFLAVETKKDERQSVKEKSETQNYGLDRYILLFSLLSFIGWAFEVGVMFAQTGKFYNQGFNTLPVCPIYGASLMVCYFLLGTPNVGKGLLQAVKNKKKRYILYLVFAFCIPTVAELIVGFVFERGFSVVLWSYDNLPLNFHGYISVPVSLAWAGLIFFFMKYAFPPLLKGVGKLPKGFSGAVAFSLTLILLADFSLNLAYTLYR